jgi:hypothetical protein
MGQTRLGAEADGWLILGEITMQVSGAGELLLGLEQH